VVAALWLISDFRLLTVGFAKVHPAVCTRLSVSKTRVNGKLYTFNSVPSFPEVGGEMRRGQECLFVHLEDVDTLRNGLITAVLHIQQS
jgi:hypothetical protein